MSDTHTLFENARALDLAGDASATQAYLAVLARDMAHAGALNNLGALFSRGGYLSAARTVWQQAVAACPDDAMARANLGNLLRREGDDAGALRHLQAALCRDPTLPEAHQGLALLAPEALLAARHRELGFAPRALTSAAFRGAGTPVRVLQVVSCHGGNIPTRLLLPDQLCMTHTIFAEYADRVPVLPSHDVAFNAIGDADLCRDGLAAATALLRRSTAPVINPPEAVLATGRAANADRLGRLPGVVAPRIVELPREALAGPDAAAVLAQHGVAFPLLLRAPGFHTGQHFVRAETAADLPGLIAEIPGDTLMAIQYLCARGADDYARKYRALFIGGQILPLHLAISDHWKVHYFTAGMTDRPDHRAEEAAFLRDMPIVLGATAMAALERIAVALALDYAGIDFALAPDGQVLLFEANATMVIAPPPDQPMWQYRQAAVAAAIRAGQGLIAHAERRANRKSERSRASTASNSDTVSMVSAPAMAV